MTSKLALFTLVLCMLPVVSGCGEDTECSPISQEITGNLEMDLVGTFDGWGIDSPVLFTFEKGGQFVFVEAPNMYAVNGNRLVGSWIVSNGELVITWGDSGRVDHLIVKVFADHLEERNAQSDVQDMSSHQRVTCQGFGF